MISEEEARDRSFEKRSARQPGTNVPLSRRLDCFSARDVVAGLPLPIFDNSAMDGYAVVASSSKKGSAIACDR